MRQYLICRLRPESHRDQLKLALPISVLCVLITRVRKTDGLTERFMRWGYQCPKLFLSSSLFHNSFPFCLYFKLFCSSTGFFWMSWLEISNPQAAINDNGMHWWISISSWCDVSICASGSISECTWRSCEGSAFSPFFPFRGFLSLFSCFHICFILSRTLSICWHESDPLLCCFSTDESQFAKGQAMWGSHVWHEVSSPIMWLAQLTPHTLSGKNFTLHVTNSNQPSHYSFLKFITFT